MKFQNGLKEKNFRSVNSDTFNCKKNIKNKKVPSFGSVASITLTTDEFINGFIKINTNVNTTIITPNISNLGLKIGDTFYFETHIITGALGYLPSLNINNLGYTSAAWLSGSSWGTTPANENRIVKYIFTIASESTCYQMRHVYLA